MFSLNRYIETARRTDAKKMRRMIEKLGETDLAIKTSKGGSGNAGARMQIELLVCEILNL